MAEKFPNLEGEKSLEELRISWEQAANEADALRSELKGAKEGYELQPASYLAEALLKEQKALDAYTEKLAEIAHNELDSLDDPKNNPIG